MRQALRYPAFRFWFIASFAGNVGTWMQRIAQDWVVATTLTDGSGAALGIIGALQFLPSLVLSPVVGHFADRYPQRVLLAGAQACGFAVAAVQGVLLLGGNLELWHAYAFATLLGVVAAVDTTLRQTIVNELLPVSLVHVGVSLNSTAFNLAALLGPAMAGVLASGPGAAWAMLANAGSYGLVFIAVTIVRTVPREERMGTPGPRRGILAGVRFLFGSPMIAAMLVPLVAISAFGMQLPITSPLMASVEFGRGAGGYAILTGANAVGSVVGSVLVSRVARPTLRLVLAAGGGYAGAMLTLAMMPTLWSYGGVLVAVGVATVFFTTACQVLVQLSAPAAIRGRVMAAYMAIYLGTVPAGSLIIGWVVQSSGARWGVAVGGLASAVAVLAVVAWMRWPSTVVRMRTEGTD